MPTDETAELVRGLLDLIASPSILTQEQMTNVDAWKLRGKAESSSEKENDEDDDDDGKDEEKISAGRCRKFLALLSLALGETDVVGSELIRSLARRLDPPRMTAFAAVCRHLAEEEGAREPSHLLRLLELAVAVLDEGARNHPRLSALRPLGEFVSREVRACEAAQEIVAGARRVLAGSSATVAPPAASTHNNNNNVKRARKERLATEDDGYRVESIVL